MTLSNAAEQALLDLLFLNVDYANIGDAGGLQNSAAAGVFYISLHTGDPGEGGAQNTSETTYTGYARVSVVRTGSGWSRSGSTISNVAAITFGECSSGTPTITHVAIGTDSSGAGNLIASAALSASLAVSPGITPSFAIGALTFALD